MGAMLLETGAVAGSVADMSTVLQQMLAMGTTLITWCLSTFPVNVGIAGGVIGIVIGVIRRSKGVGR